MLSNIEDCLASHELVTFKLCADLTLGPVDYYLARHMYLANITYKLEFKFVFKHGSSVCAKMVCVVTCICFL